MMAKNSRPIISSLVYGLYEGGYRINVFVDGVMRAVGKARDRVEGEHLARDIKRRLKRGAALPVGVSAP